MANINIIDADSILNVTQQFRDCVKIFIALIEVRNNSMYNLPFSIEIHEGRKYIKLVELMANGQKSVHSFISKESGDIFKAASWKSPATQARGNIFIDNGKQAFGNDWQIRYL